MCYFINYNECGISRTVGLVFYVKKDSYICGKFLGKFDDA